MRKINDMRLEFRKDMVFQMIDCHPDSPVYQQVQEEFERMKSQALQKARAEAVLEYGLITQEAANDVAEEGTEALFLIVTIGSQLSSWSTELFQKGEYLAGMLADAMADDLLMQASDSVKDAVMEECRERGRGIVKRLEAPTNIGMEVQKLAFQVTDAASHLGIRIMDSYMFDPIKTLCQVFLLGEGCGESWVDHDCSDCNSVNCKMRKKEFVSREAVAIEVLQTKGVSRHISCNGGQSLMDALREAGLYLPAICAGRGTCGKCRIKVAEGVMVPTQQDRDTFTVQELEEGWRLACKAYPVHPLAIRLTDGIDEQMEILGEEENAFGKAFSGSFFLSIDIGTTTIAMSLADQVSGEIIESYTGINRQRSFGADVISRIEAAGKGQGQVLRKLICQDLWQGICQLVRGREGDCRITKVVIAANTTMIHLLMGFPCESLGVFPFTPYEINTIDTTLGEVLGDILWEESGSEMGPEMERGTEKKKKGKENKGKGEKGKEEKEKEDKEKEDKEKEDREYWQGVRVMIIPGISAFVGGDIVSDLLFCEIQEKEEIILLIDLGTNGEMAVGNKDRILVTSTAAGPAFEGGNIICGTGSIPGAISRVNVCQEKTEISTILDKYPPVGICGTGVMEALYELWKNELIDETGLLDEEYFESGFLLGKSAYGQEIRIYQKDIRELQLAKAAVRAGVETLLLRFGITAGQIQKVCVAGGFGVSLDMEKAAAVGLLPKELLGKIETVGNGALKGALLYGAREEARENAEKIRLRAAEINLSNDVFFNERYMDSMFFENEG